MRNLAGKRSVNRHVRSLMKVYADHIRELYDLESQSLPLWIHSPEGLFSLALNPILEELPRQAEGNIKALQGIMNRLSVSPHETHFRETSHLITRLKHVLTNPARRHNTRHEVVILSSLHELVEFKLRTYATCHSYARLLSFHVDLASLEHAYAKEKATQNKVEQRMRELQKVSIWPEFEISA